MIDTLSRRAANVALVLGAGGPVGRAFHAGVLHALAETCGWDPRESELILGTSAGAQVGALLRAGVSAPELYAHATGAGSPTDDAAHAFAWPAQSAVPPVGARTFWPGSLHYLRRALRRPWHARPGHLISAALPEGRQCNRPLGEAFARLHGERWPARALWITAVDFDSGARVIFGRAGAPAVDVGTAVRCSSAVPGLRQPVRVGAERYVDGGIASATHAGLLAEALADERPAPRVALVLSPLSRFAPLRLLLRAELRRLARRGIPVIAWEPEAEVASAMSWNPMDARLAPRLAEVAYRMTLRRLHRHDAGPLRSWLTP